MSFGTVTIDAVSYPVYGTLAEASSYLAAASHAAAAWAAAIAAADDSEKRALASATRMLDRQSWAGAKTVAGQAHAWPRDGITDVTDGTTPAEIDAACYELAAAILSDAAGAQSLAGTAGNIQAAGASGASVTFFAPTKGTRLPDIVHELVRAYLGGTVTAGAFGGSWVSGTDAESQFDDCDTYRRR